MKDNKRSVKILKEARWVDVEFSEVNEGDLFKMYEPDGELVESLGTTEFKALSKAYIGENGVLTIKV